jgi:hypothetical protein
LASTIQTPRPDLAKRQNQFLYFILIVLTLLISGTVALQSNCIIQPHGSQVTFSCDGVAALFFRDQLGTTNGPIPYLNYPFEYFLIGGLIQSAVNLFSRNILSSNDAGMIYISTYIMSLFAIGSLLLLNKFGIKGKRTLAFFLTPIAFLFALSFDYAQIFLLVLSIYLLLTPKKTTTSSIIFGLSCLIKLYPLAFLPFILRKTTNKLRYTLTSLATVGGGLSLQFLLNPHNFLRASSYLTTYGIEGSWLGLLFPQDVINYSTTNTWIIGNGTQIPIPHTYQLLSATLFISVLALIYFKGKALPLFDQLFLSFSSALIFLWISAPQMFLNLIILAPLTTIAVNKLNLTLWNLASLFSCDIIVLYYILQFRTSAYTSLYLQIMVMCFLALLITLNYIRPHTKLIGVKPTPAEL